MNEQVTRSPLKARGIGYALAGLVSAGFALALGWNHSLWFDEGYTMLVLDKPFARMMSLLTVDAHPPLYYLSLRGWAALFGSNVVALSAMSALLCGLTTVAMTALIDFLAGAQYARFVLPFLVLAPLLLRYGYEIRMYSMMSLFSVLGTYALLRAVNGRQSAKGRRRWWVIYACVVALGMYTQYLIALVWISHVIWLVCRMWSETHGKGSGEGNSGGAGAGTDSTDAQKSPAGFGPLCAPRARLSWRWVWAYLGGIVLYLPWLPFAFMQITHSALPPSNTPLNLNQLGNIFTIMTTALTGARVNATVTLALLVMVVLWARVCVSARDDLRRGGVQRISREGLVTQRAMIILAYFFVAPTLLLMIIAVFQEVLVGSHGFFTFRYVCAFAPFGYGCIGLLCSYAVCRRTQSSRTHVSFGSGRKDGRVRIWFRTWSSWTFTLAVLACGSVGLYIQGNYIYERSTVPHAAQVSSQVQCSADSAVVTADEYTYIDSYYYYRGCRNYFFLKKGQVQARGGYAPLRGGTSQLHSLDDLRGVGRITYLSWSGNATAHAPQTRRFRLIAMHKVYEFTVIDYEPVCSHAAN